MRVVVALGGNALLRRGQPMTAENQVQNVATACDRLAPIAEHHELVVSHGNGPQIGLLALEEAAYEAAADSPMDVLGAETQGMIGYLVERELGNRLPYDKPLASLLTMIEVDPNDPAFDNPTKPIGPLYTSGDAQKLAADRGWTFKPDGDSMRRVVPSPAPKHIFERRPIRWLLEQGCVVICAGGGGIPTAYRSGRQLGGVEAVIDKDLGAAMLARLVHADLLVVATDVPQAVLRFGTPDAEPLGQVTLGTMRRHAAEGHFASGSMGPKVDAVCRFVAGTGRPGVITSLARIVDAVTDVGSTGTVVVPD